MDRYLTGGRGTKEGAKNNKWISFIKKIQTAEKCTYKEAMIRAKPRYASIKHGKEEGEIRHAESVETKEERRKRLNRDRVRKFRAK
jgi:hypothetical protein